MKKTPSKRLARFHLSGNSDKSRGAGRAALTCARFSLMASVGFFVAVPSCVQDQVLAELGENCGDGVVDVDEGEECDDGNNLSHDGCSADCHNEAGREICNSGLDEDNDGFIDCDDDDCANHIWCNPICGNGVLQLDEECDDGEDTASCDADCTAPACGDGHLNAAAGEQCDDGNTTAQDGCDANCQSEAVCGDGIVGSDEECDDGNTDNDCDGCTNTCTLREDCTNRIDDDGDGQTDCVDPDCGNCNLC